jgi:putative FmdB family regulatory protein
MEESRRMPIYEFYCPACHTIYNFLSRCVNTEKVPHCPGCKKDSLTRRVSRFAVISRGKNSESDSELDNLPIDESKMESAMTALASQAEGIDENDPKAAAQLMRKFSSMTGLHYSESIEQALSRLEAGEDPDTIEQEMGDVLDSDELPFALPGRKSGGKRTPPKRDETLYEM